jgi:hypothetical protein
MFLFGGFSDHDKTSQYWNDAKDFFLEKKCAQVATL